MDIDQILRSIQHLESELSKYRSALLALQKTCEHDWLNEGHSHNYDLYRCDKCQKEERR